MTDHLNRPLITNQILKSIIDERIPAPVDFDFGDL